jgi:hypothetical protein
MTHQLHDFALVVGIQHYPEYRHLTGSVADAQAFADWLTVDSNGGGLPKANCELIVSGPGPPPVPVKTQIDDAIGRIQDASAAGARRFYFYFSGHGMGTDALDLALCLATWHRKRAFAALSYTEYFNFFLALGSFQEVVFLLDCCRVREIAVGGLRPEVSVIRQSGTTGAVSTFTAFAAEIGNAAYEAKLAEEEAQGQQPGPRGHFTEALMEALRGGAASPGRGVTAQRLEEHLKKRTTEIAARHKHSQVARVRPDLRPGVNIIFGDYPPISNVIIEFVPARPVPVVLFGPLSEKIKSGTADTGPWELNLTAGNYCLQENGNEHFFRVGGGPEMVYERF